jgi:hypothetical protein
MKKLLRGESTISLEAAVLKCPNAELYLYLTFPRVIQYIHMDVSLFTEVGKDPT